jgi:hypothetical protein
MNFMLWVRGNERAHPELKRLFHVPNGKARSEAAAGQLKAEGVRQGVLDYWWPWSVTRNVAHGVKIVHTGLVIAANDKFTAIYHPGLAFELKRRNASPSGTSDEQSGWMAYLSSQGWRTGVCRGAEEAIALVCDYSGIQRR